MARKILVADTPFKEKYLSLPHIKMAPTREKIIEACGITKTTFYSWLRGDTAPPKPAMNVIAQIFNCSVEDIFPIN